MPLSSPPLPPGLRRVLSSRQGWLVGIWLVCVTLIGLWFFQSTTTDRRNTVNMAESHLRSQVELASIEINGKIESGDLALRTIVALLGANPNWRTIPRDPLLWRILNDVSDSMAAKPRLVLIDNKGGLRLHSHAADPGQVSLTERDYFQHHRDNSSEEPFLGAPVFGKIANATVIPFSRRVSQPDGSFGGVALISLDPAIYSAFFRSLDHDNKIVFTLLRGDGTVLVRHPAIEGAVGNKVDIASLSPLLSDGKTFGSTISISPQDGLERLSSFRRLERFDLTIVATLPVETALKPWREQTRRMEGVIAACLFLITAAALVLLRHMRAEAAAWIRIAASEAGLNRAQAVARVGSWQARLPELSLTCSDEARRLFALPIGGPIRREDVLERIHPEDRDRVLDAVRQTRQGRPLDIEHRLLINGTVTWIRLRAEISSQPTGGGEILGTVQDITERRQADESLRHQAEELARSNTELEQFAYVASHDLREPLRMIASFVDLLGRRYGDRLDQDGLDFIAFAREGAARMDRLVLDLLDYSRIGRICKPMQTVDLGVLTDRVFRALALKIAESGVDIVLPTPPLPKVTGDPDELVRLLQNLIDNAIKYREPSRSVRVTVSAERHGGEVTIAVADNGIGIDPQYFDRIFGIFQRLHTRESFEGTGIGLAICKKIVERHGGRIWVNSVPGAGSTFFFTLPTADPA